MDATTSAQGNLEQVTARISGSLRLTSALWCGLGAMLALGPPARRNAVVIAVIVVVLWSVGYCAFAWRNRLGRALLFGDLAIVASLCVAQPWLVAADRLPEGVGWVTPLTTVAIVAMQLCVPAATAIPVALVLGLLHIAVAAHMVGLASMRGLAVTLVLQIVLTALMMVLLRRVVSRADLAMARATRGAVRTESARRRLRAEREFQRMIHDTALATLTMVGSGSIGNDTGLLRTQCMKDLAELRQLGAVPGRLHPAPVDVVDALRSAAEDMVASQFAVELSMPDALVLPDDVADALIRCTRQALINARHHARTAGAVVTVSRTTSGVRAQAPDVVTVSIVDEGIGFDVNDSAEDRLGLRYSIRDRMSDAGGHATIRSVAGAGTEVRLQWPA
ncbi:sensor histidine kinase [Plantactinospora solaniradicis]|uniref:histidine kinase n=1 Tax=Plantactinospora solaniradicis TaxID=1723736 RepID=A0ABW1KAD3_9ACTN